MKVTKERIIRTLESALVRAPSLPEPTTENHREWIDSILQALDDMIFDYYVEFTPHENPDEVILKEVSHNFNLKNGSWGDLLGRFDERVKRLRILLSIDAPKSITEDAIDLITRTLDTIKERVEEA